MEHSNHNRDTQSGPAPAINGTRRSQNRSVRVSFGTGPDSVIPTRDRSPTPLSSHQRSFTEVESQKSSRPSSAHRPSPSLDDTSGDTPAEDAPPPSRPGIGGRPVSLQRAKSDYGPRSVVSTKAATNEEDDFAMRHGWQEEYTSTEYLKLLNSVCYIRWLVLYDDADLGTRISICISQKNDMKRVVYRKSRLEVGPYRSGV